MGTTDYVKFSPFRAFNYRQHPEAITFPLKSHVVGVEWAIDVPSPARLVARGGAYTRSLTYQVVF